MILLHVFFAKRKATPLYSKLQEFQILIKTITPTVVCLQETNFKNDYVATLANYNSYHKIAYTAIGLAEVMLSLYINHTHRYPYHLILN